MPARRSSACTWECPPQLQQLAGRQDAATASQVRLHVIHSHVIDSHGHASGVARRGRALGEPEPVCTRTPSCVCDVKDTTELVVVRYDAMRYVDRLEDAEIDSDQA